jgi:hypothetical protein
MSTERAIWRNALVRALLVAVAAGGAGACASNPLALGKLDQTSPVAADVAAAQRAPGPYPSFSHIPPVPTDVRPARAWRASVYDTWGLKRQTEAEAASIPFVLVPGEADGWAAAERSKIPDVEMIPPSADASEQAEAFAAAQRARATPPPPPK